MHTIRLYGIIQQKGDELMDTFRMKCFIAAAETGSLTKAAEKMNMTQPAISFQIREMEKETELTLFKRDRNGVTLTEAGKVMKDGCINLLDSYDSILKQARLGSNGKNMLRIGYHGPIDWAGVHSFLASFSEKYPNIEVVVLQQQWRELASYLEMGALDVAFLATEELSDHKKLDSMGLFREDTCFAISPRHRLSAQSSALPEDIRDETILMNDHVSASMTATINKLIDSGIPLHHFRFFDQMDITLAMAASQQGIAAIPCSFIIENPALRYVVYDTEKAWMSYSLAWLAETDNEAVRIFRHEVERANWPFVSKGQALPA